MTRARLALYVLNLRVGNFRPTRKQELMIMVTKIKSQETEIVPATSEGYSSIAQVLPRLAEIIEFNRVDFTRLPTIKVPTGGNTSYNITDLDSEHPEAEILGVVVSWNDYRVFWEKAIDDPEGESGRPPDCYSTDAITGSLTVGEINQFAAKYNLLPHKDHAEHNLATCHNCPFAAMGTAKKGQGRGQWCKSRMHLYVLQPETVLPYILSVPPKSLKPVVNYFTHLAAKGLPAYAVISSFRLVAEKNADNIKYSEIRPQKAHLLSGEEALAMKEYHEALKPYLSAITGNLIQEESQPLNGTIEPESGEVVERPF
jgi:hypothetical protein